jgi:hypothetical protein
MFERFKAEKRLRDLSERMDEWEHQMRTLRMEWESTYEKMHQLLRRLAKRAEMAAKVEEPSPEAEATEQGPSVAHGLSQRQQEANARILARRNRLQIGPQ